MLGVVKKLKEKIKKENLLKHTTSASYSNVRGKRIAKIKNKGKV